MLNEIVRRLNGHGEDPQSLGEELKQLDVQEATERAGLLEAHRRRREHLLDDASDSTLDTDEREIARRQIRLEKITIAKPLVRERLRVSEIAARQRRWLSHREAYCAAAAGFLSSARVTYCKHAAL